MFNVQCSILNACLIVAFLDGAIAHAWAGSITGTITKPAGVTSVVAVSRGSGEQHVGTIDLESGKFRIPGIRPGTPYDCVIEFADSKLEGINLSVPRSDYVEEQPLEDEEIEILKEKAHRLDKFATQIDVLAVRGNIQHASILLNKVRRGSYEGGGGGEVVWRAELWHFERPEETWVKVQHEMFIVLYRERIPGSEYDSKSITFDSDLGNLISTIETPDLDLSFIKPPITEKGIHYRGDKLVTGEATEE